MRAGYPTRGVAVLLAFLVAYGPLRARGESPLFPDVYPELAHAGGPKVVVLAVSLDKEADKKLGLLEGLGERAVDAAGRFDSSPLSFALDPDLTRARQQAQAKADQALKDGQKALDDLDALKALKLADEAMAQSKAGEPATRRGFETYVLAGVMRAAAMVANGDNDAAKAEIAKILVYAPKAQFPDTQFPPDLIKYAEAQRKAVQKATGTIIVRSDPPGAKVTIDGVFRGYAPVSATGFAPGQHLAVAQLGGYQTIAGEIPVDDQTVKLKPAEASSRLQLARDKVKQDPDGPGRDAAARDFGRLLSADQVLLLIGKASLTPGKLELTAERVEVKDGHNDGFRSGQVEPVPQALEGFIGSVLLNDEPRAGSSPVTHFGSGGKGGSGRTILAFSLWGLAAAGLGVGIFSGIEASDRVSQYKKTLQVQTIASANLEREGKSFALIADLSYAVAILAAAAGTFFFLTRPKAAPATAEPVAAPPEKKQPPAETAKPPPEERKKPEEQKKADETKKPEEKKPDETKKPEEEKKDTRTEKQKRADEKKRLAEEKKRAEEERKEEERRKKEEAKEEKRRKEEEAREEKRKAEEQKKADAEAKKAEEQRKADEKKKADDDAKKAEDQKKADEKKKADDDAKAAAEQKKADEQRKADEAKKADEQRRADQQKSDAAKKAEELRKQQEAEQKKKDEQRKKQQQDDEDLRNQ